MIFLRRNEKEISSGRGVINSDDIETDANSGRIQQQADTMCLSVYVCVHVINVHARKIYHWESPSLSLGVGVYVCALVLLGLGKLCVLDLALIDIYVLARDTKRPSIMAYSTEQPNGWYSRCLYLKASPYVSSLPAAPLHCKHAQDTRQTRALALVCVCVLVISIQATFDFFVRAQRGFTRFFFSLHTYLPVKASYQQFTLLTSILSSACFDIAVEYCIWPLHSH